MSQSPFGALFPAASKLALANYAAVALGLLLTLVATRVLGADGFGLVALTLSYPSLIWALSATKPINVAPRYLSLFHEQGRHEEFGAVCKFGYAIDLATAVAAALLIGATSGWVAVHIVRQPELAGLIVIVGISLPFSCLKGTSVAILLSTHRFGWMAAVQILEKLLLLVSVSAALIAGYGVAGMVAATAASQAIHGVVTMLLAGLLLRASGFGSWWRSPLARASEVRREFVRLLGWNYFDSTVGGVVEQVPLMLLGRLSVPGDVGYLHLSRSLVTVASYVETSLGRVAYQKLAAVRESATPSETRSMLLRWTAREGLAVGALIFAGIVALPLAVPLLFGEEFRPMVPGTQVLMVSYAMSAVFFWLSAYHYAAGEIATWSLTKALYAGAVLVSGWFLAQGWGFWGMAVAISLSRTVWLGSLGGRVLTRLRS